MAGVARGVPEGGNGVSDRKKRRAPDHTRADLIKEALRKRHQGETFLTEVKTGPTMYAEAGSLQKIDALAIKPSWANPRFTAYEVKVSRSDFLADDKWTNYLSYCHKFYWACSTGLIKPEEVSDPCGLVWVNGDGGWSVRKAALYRPIEIPWEMLYYIIISKLRSDRHPFFSSTKEYFEAYVQDKHDKILLGDMVSEKWRADLAAMDERVKQAERRAKEAELALQVLEVLKQQKIRVTDWGGKFSPAELVERLQSNAPSGLKDRLQQAQSAITNALWLLDKATEKKEADAS